MPSLGFTVGGLDALATLIEIRNGAGVVLGSRQGRDQNDMLGALAMSAHQSDSYAGMAREHHRLIV